MLFVRVLLRTFFPSKVCPLSFVLFFSWMDCPVRTCSIALTRQSVFCFFFLSDLQTVPPNNTGITENTAIIAGVVAALVLLVALTLLAVYYINTHPTVAPPFYLMQVRKTNSCILQSQLFIYLFIFFSCLKTSHMHTHVCLLPGL